MSVQYSNIQQSDQLADDVSGDLLCVVAIHLSIATYQTTWVCTTAIDVIYLLITAWMFLFSPYGLHYINVFTL